MKEIIGTISLAFVEEDNKQKVIFRVIPLCTKEGGLFHGAKDFPDVGSLRVVPDKREQSTFKERMRSIGGLCAIQLQGDGRDLMKVRQNRNYAPEQGEDNQYAIYSDVICRFAEESCMEVVQPGLDASGALTALVLVLKNKVLYGPIAREDVADADVSALKPFGNDRFLLQTIDMPGLGKHQIYWNPESTLNWRQHRLPPRRRERALGEEALPVSDARSLDESAGEPLCAAAAMLPTPPETPLIAAEKPPIPATPPTDRPMGIDQAASASAQPVARSLAEKPAAPVSRPATPFVKPTMPAPVQRSTAGADRNAARAQDTQTARKTEDNSEKSDSPLPIGERLSILNEELPHDLQISRLEQPLSDHANRLTEDLEEPEEDSTEPIARFSGTPLTPAPIHNARTASRPESVHRVVEKQIREKIESGEHDTESLTWGLMDNPIENLQSSLDFIWQDADLREQAIAALMDDELFVRDMLRAFQKCGLNPQATAAAQEQLTDIEAERLSLVMQLESAKTNLEKFRTDALAALAQKRRDQSERLQRSIGTLEVTRKRLEETVRALSCNVADKVTDYLARNMQCLSGAGEQRILLTPVLGHAYAPDELTESLRSHMNDSGYSLCEDDAQSLLVNFALCDALCLKGTTLTDAVQFAGVLLESFGLKSQSAVVYPGAYVEMISLLDENDLRTPTVTVQLLGTETMTIFGHKTLYVTDDQTELRMLDAPAPYPIIAVPPLVSRPVKQSADWEAVASASLGSFTKVCQSAKTLQPEAEKWFVQMKDSFAAAKLALPETLLQCIHKFIETASQRVRGGFIAAADMAICCWLAPILLENRDKLTELMPVLAGMPRSLEKLNVL